MTQDRLGDLAALTEALYETERAKLRDLIRQETGLRNDLALLEARRLGNQRVMQPGLPGFREIGADLLWHGWIGRTRTDLQTELARVLARKGQMMTTLRRAFGKHQATLILQAAALEKTRKQALSRQDQDLALLSSLHRIKSP